MTTRKESGVEQLAGKWIVKAGVPLTIVVLAIFLALFFGLSPTAPVDVVNGTDITTKTYYLGDLIYRQDAYDLIQKDREANTRT